MKHNHFAKSSIVTEASHIKSIIQPLTIYGIQEFFFVRIYNDGYLIDLATHPGWAKLFFEKFYQLKYHPADLHQHFFFRDKVSLWAHNPKNAIWQDGAKHFDFGNGISIFKETTNFTDIFSFYTTSSNHEINNFYINNLDILEKFISYFTECAKNIIQHATRNRFLVPEYYNNNLTMESTRSPIQCEFTAINQTEMKQDPQLFQLLTNRERECLYWLCVGKSSEEIGLILGCSPRTIECHIDNMKRKQNFTKVTQLAYFAGKLNLLDRTDIQS